MTLTRRQLLSGLIGLGAGAGLAACSRGGTTSVRVDPSAVASVEATRSTTGSVRSVALTARPVTVDLGGTVVDTWGYGDRIPGQPLRVTAGDRLQVAFRNELPVATSVHWHGLAIRNDMDGVPGLTTPETPPGDSFAFDFLVPDPGTHWFHPHSGLQLDTGLYAPLIVDDPAEPGDHDQEWVVVLDDWTHGLGRSPEEILADLGGTTMGHGGMGGTGGMGGMGHGGMGGRDGGDVNYPLYLINGRGPTDPDVLRARAGQRVRLRIINAAADTMFDVALAGHDLLITHTDGYPVVPVATPVLRIGMGERYDATVSVTDGVHPLVAQPVGKDGTARALVHAGAGTAPPADYRPREVDDLPLTVGALQGAAGSALPARAPDTVQDVVLSGSMAGYTWTINGRTYADTVPLTIRLGQAGRFRLRNMSMMPHPLHLHGHTFQLGPSGGTGPRKDTLLLPAMGSATVDLAADNPGQWMVHCHNAYHAEAGMMTRLDYVA